MGGALLLPKGLHQRLHKGDPGIRQALDEFEKLGVVVLGISTDSVSTQRRFAEKYGVKFKLLSDSEKRASQAYGVLRPTGTAERVTFIINPEARWPR